ncbi:hypothetical protein GCM10010449_81800 [Streptomyces rectiviolaceus]|uniref:Secreted protein n=1 Tax=Streptomyces rectiviolaceus TaxID=332591 RepID=A0ABP6NM95_9ACTN
MSRIAVSVMGAVAVIALGLAVPASAHAAVGACPERQHVGYAATVTDYEEIHVCVSDSSGSIVDLDSVD